MGLRAGDWGRAGERWYRFDDDRPVPVDEADVPEEARAALTRMEGQIETIEALAELGAPGAGEALAQLCDGALEERRK